MSEDERLDEILGALPREQEPSADLEERVVKALRSRGDLGPRRRSALGRRLGWAAALLAAFLAGRLTAPAPTAREPGGSRFLLLLSALPDEGAAGTAGAAEERFAEYSGWAGRLAGEGHLVAADELDRREVRLGPSETGAATAPSRPSGFFLLRARDLDEALAIARSCPHLKHGGSVSVRPVAPPRPSR